MGNSLQRRWKTPENSTESTDPFTCEICTEPRLPNQKFVNTDYCTHPFCQKCIAKYIEVKVLDNTANIKCPGLNCQHLLSPVSCKTIISSSLFVKWSDLLCETYVLRWRRIYCPNRVCSELVVNECHGTVKKSKCPKCKMDFCFRCGIEWHDGYGCDRTGRKNDVLFRQLAKNKNWVRCPSCAHFVERLSGCNIITCRCETVFCHHCGTKLSKLKCYCGKAQNELRASIEEIGQFVETLHDRRFWPRRG